MASALGFHGDHNLLKIVEYLIGSSKYYIETGTHIGHTFHYMCRTYSYIKCLGCEPAKGRFETVAKRVAPFKHTKVFHETSQKFLKRLDRYYTRMFDKSALIWLDAHSKEFKWPLKEEIEFFTYKMPKSLILIDDFKVPNNPQFRFNKFGNQRYTLQYIKQYVHKDAKPYLYLPKYGKNMKPKSFTGWLLIQMDKSIGRLDKLFPNLIGVCNA
jgi:hypothetical protein